MNLDNIDLVLRARKISYHKSTLDSLKSLPERNEYLETIFSRIEQFLNYLDTLLEQIYRTDKQEIKKRLLDTIDDLSLSMNDTYDDVINFIITKDTKINCTIKKISKILKEALKIKTDIVILDGIEFASTPYFTSMYKEEKSPIEGLFTVTIDSSLSIFGIPQIVHEYGHLIIKENYDMFKELIHKLEGNFNSVSKSTKIVEKIEELTCDVFAANVFGILYIYSYLIAFKNNFNSSTEEHFDDYFRMVLILKFLRLDNNVDNLELLSEYEESSSDYRKYSHIIGNVADTYCKFFKNNYNNKINLTSEKKILSDAFNRLLDSGSQTKFDEITEIAINDLLRTE
jgi:hypothetical protein